MQFLFNCIDAIKLFAPCIVVFIIIYYLVKIKRVEKQTRTRKMIFDIVKNLDSEHKKILYAIFLYIDVNQWNIAENLRPFLSKIYRIIFNEAITVKQRANQIIFFLDNEYKTEYDQFFSKYKQNLI